MLKIYNHKWWHYIANCYEQTPELDRLEEEFYENNQDEFLGR